MMDTKKGQLVSMHKNTCTYDPCESRDSHGGVSSFFRCAAERHFLIAKLAVEMYCYVFHFC
jgi:hypothetical protein